MKTLRRALLAASIGAVAATAIPAQARPHRHKVCRTEWVHHHKIRRCHWR